MHHVDLVLPVASWVVKLHEGRIEAQETVAQLRESGLLSLARKRQNEWAEDGDAIVEEVVVAETMSEKKSVRKLVDEEKKST